MTKKTKILDKIRLLFNLAENNPSEEEATLALKRAKDLLIEYQLSEMDLEDRKREVSDAEVDAFEPGCIDVQPPQSRMHKWISVMCGAICDFYEVCYYYIKGNTFAKIPPHFVFYGLKTNCEVAGFAFHSIYTQINKLAKKYKPSKHEFHLQGYYSDFAIFSVQARFEYRQGLARGLQNRAYEEKKRNEEKHGEKCTALATRSKEAADTWVKDSGISLSYVKSKNPGSFGTGTDASSQGQKDASKIDVHGRGLSDSSTKEIR